MCDKCQYNRAQVVAMGEEMSSAEKSREFYRRQGECRERERIIKLLEEMKQACLSSTSEIGDHNAWTLENAIALIKGEN